MPRFLKSPWFWIPVAALVLAVATTGPFILTQRDSGDVPRRGPAVSPVELSGTPFVVPALTHEARELRRVADEHSALLTSVPPTPGPTALPSVEEVRIEVSQQLSLNPGGIPVAPVSYVDWFEPTEGLYFYRPEGGDWTSRTVRRSHPYATLFYPSEPLVGLPAFHDGSIVPALARELAFGASEVMPFLGDPTPALIGSFASQLGWELRPGTQPAVNLWTTFRFRDRETLHVYAVGGVMLLRLHPLPVSEDGESPGFYLAAGDLQGRVVVERLVLESGS